MKAQIKLGFFLRFFLGGGGGSGDEGGGTLKILGCVCVRVCGWGGVFFIDLPREGSSRRIGRRHQVGEMKRPRASDSRVRVARWTPGS